MAIVGFANLAAGAARSLVGAARALLGGGEGTGSLFRAVSPAEAGDILKNGFRPEPTGMSIVQGKWFATSIADAAKWGSRFYGSQPYNIVEATVPADALSTMMKNPKMDSIGTGVFATIEQLVGVSARIVR